MVAAGKDQAQEIDGPVGTEGEMCVIDDEQGRRKGLRFKVQSSRGSRLRLSERRAMLASGFPSESRLDRRSKVQEVSE